MHRDQRPNLEIPQHSVDIGGVERAVRGLVDHQLIGPRGDLIQNAVAGRPQGIGHAKAERLFLEPVAPAKRGGKIAPVRQHGPSVRYTTRK